MSCTATQIVCVCIYVHKHTLMTFFHDHMIVHWNMIMYRQMSLCAWWMIVIWRQMYILGCFKQELLEDNHRSYWVC